MYHRFALREFHSFFPFAAILGAMLFPPLFQAIIRLHLEPEQTTISRGETTDIALLASGAQDLFACELHIYFNPAIIEVIDADPNIPGTQVSPGAFFIAKPGLTIINSVDNSTGEIVFIYTLLSQSNTSSEESALVEFSVRGKTTGDARLRLEDIILSDINGTLLDYAPQITSLEIDAGSPVTPSPGTSQNPTATQAASGSTPSPTKLPQPSTPSPAAASPTPGSSRITATGTDTAAATATTQALLTPTGKTPTSLPTHSSGGSAMTVTPGGQLSTMAPSLDSDRSPAASPFQTKTATSLPLTPGDQDQDSPLFTLPGWAKAALLVLGLGNIALWTAIFTYQQKKKRGE